MAKPFEHAVLAVRVPTDTAHPQAIVPIYLIHTLARPFCSLPGCWCHTHQPEITSLLEALTTGELTMGEAASFVEGGTV
jgi:hypothetical protein